MCQHVWKCETYPVNFLVNAKCENCGQETKLVAVFPMGRAETVIAGTGSKAVIDRRWARHIINQILNGNGKQVFEGTRRVHVSKLHGIYERR